MLRSIRRVTRASAAELVRLTCIFACEPLLQLKPMNCPFHISIYKQGFYSYRDLPIRWAELGTGACTAARCEVVSRHVLHALRLAASAGADVLRCPCFVLQSTGMSAAEPCMASSGFGASLRQAHPVQQLPPVPALLPCTTPQPSSLPAQQRPR